MILPTLTAIAPPSNLVEMGISVVQLGVVAASYGAERSAPTLYSKFANLKEGTFESPIPSQVGMLILYVPAMIVAAGFSFLPFMHQSLAAPLLFIHFLKRTLEVLGLHKFSGSMPQAQAIGIGTFYSLITTLVASCALPVGNNDEAWVTIGYVLFAIGQLGNLYHHYLLASLRKNDTVPATGKNRYVPPTGGLFCFVATPHYLFELIAWLGIACCAQQANAFLAFCGMTSYLSGRATNTNEWYKEVFSEKEWDSSKKAILPFIF